MIKTWDILINKKTHRSKKFKQYLCKQQNSIFRCDLISYEAVTTQCLRKVDSKSLLLLVIQTAHETWDAKSENRKKTIYKQ